MKELTIEEKAHNYDEAVEKIHRFIDGYSRREISKEELEDMFPELKESEDEKTKRILHSISSKISFHLCDIFTEEEFQCFDAWSDAWLEKQGEQNLANSAKTCKDEQKPAKLSKEIPTDLKDIVDNEANAIWEEESSDGCHLVIDSYNMFYGICMQISEAVVDYKKPAWSEEDKDYYDAIIAKLEVTQEDAALTDNQMEFLKSLKDRYTWKPSEKEMVALEHAINCYSGISPTNGHEVFILEIMKDRLKKLREE